MKHNPRILAGCLVALLSLACVLATRATGASLGTADAAATATQLERGRYLVHRAGLCIDCHSPRNAQGEFIETKHLAGAPIGFTPVAPMPWAPVAPRLAGLPAGFTRADLVHFLMTGERPQGRPRPLPPMPAYRFDRDDAEAIVAYLGSLPPPAP